MSKVITPRVDETVLPLATVRLFCRIDGSVDDLLLEIWRAAAFEKAEHETSQSIGLQVRELALDAFPTGAIKLPYGPVNSITSVTYIDLAGDAIVLNNGQYTLDTYSKPDWLLPAVNVSWPDTLEVANAVKIRYSAGTNSIPGALKDGLMVLIDGSDKHRGTNAAHDRAARYCFQTVKDYS